jgi:hypothetical protein
VDAFGPFGVEAIDDQRQLFDALLGST